MITSSSNARIKRIKQLEADKKERDKEGVFVAEGEKLFFEIVRDHPESILEVFVSESAFAALPDDKKAALERFETETVKDSVFESAALTKTPQGFLAVVKKPSYRLEDILKREGRLRLLFLETLQDPGNMGTIFRTAEGAGIDMILLSRNCADVFNPKVVRSTMGSVMRVPFAEVRDSLETLEVLKKAGVTTYATFLKASEEIGDIAYDERTAILIGNEAKGLAEATAMKCDHRIRIPMQGKLESLNAAVAAALVMYRDML